MANTKGIEPAPALSAGNRLYLYGLLAREIGCGKQTFITHIERALAGERLTGADLGFADTRALLEALSDFVTLTVFKGGRVYATVTAVPEWDTALEAAASPAADAGTGSGKRAVKGNKPWKRKKGGKSLKPVRPRRVTREPEREPEDSAERTAKEPAKPLEGSASGTDAAGQRPNDARGKDAAEAEGNESAAEKACAEGGVVAQAGDRAPEPDAGNEPTDRETSDAAKARAASLSDAAAPAASEGAGATPDAPAPGIALTITYDPYTGEEGETVLSSSMNRGTAVTPRDAGPRRAEPPARPRIEGAPASEASRPAVASPRLASPSASALSSYPRDFALEVHCPGGLLSELARIVPLRADALTILTEDFRVARGSDTVRGTRSHASFPTRFAGRDGTPVTVTIRRSVGTPGTPAVGAPWAVSAIGNIDDTLLAETGIDGLPLVPDGPWFLGNPNPADALASSPRRRFAETALCAEDVLVGASSVAAVTPADTAALRLQLALAWVHAQRIGSWAEAGDGSRASFPTGLLTSGADPVVAVLSPTGDDIPWRLIAFEAAGTLS